jgi:hypothetical protein
MMNRFVDILNRIRQKANPNWLTPSQQRTYNLLRQRLGFPDKVNLWHEGGVGGRWGRFICGQQGDLN